MQSHPEPLTLSGTFPLHIGDAIPGRDIEFLGEMFYSQTVQIPDVLPGGGRFYLSSEQSGASALLVDDAVTFLLEGTEAFYHVFSDGTRAPELAIGEVPRATMERLTRKMVTVEYLDVYGVRAGASAMWLIPMP